MADTFGVTMAGLTLSRNANMTTPFFTMTVSSGTDKYSGQGSVTRTLVDETTWLDLPDVAPDISQSIIHNSSSESIIVSCLAASARACFRSGSVMCQRNADSKAEVVRTDGIAWESPSEGWGPWQRKGPTSQYDLKSGITMTVIRGFGHKWDGTYEHLGAKATTLTLGAKRLFDMETGIPSDPVSKPFEEVSVVGLSPLTVIVPAGQVAIVPGMYLRAGAHIQKTANPEGAPYAVEFYCAG